ncbi:MAG: heavy metal-associated domain-containing protein [Lutibacter sp.]|nr:heavy metal-associated domain-containing protein [Lutibacter sp.]MDP3945368.1 heavy metal-associated domain-containing protein [Lutibacter sp.]
MKTSISILALAFFLFSCNDAKKQDSIEKSGIEKQEVAANYKTIEVEIEGMTCEIGCAKTIESKLSKTKGVTYSKVSFEDKVGQFTYDENKISKEDIAKKIVGIGGGALYKATKITEIEEIKAFDENK